MPSQSPHLCDTLPQAKLAQTTAGHSSPSSHDPPQASVPFQNEKSLKKDDLRTDPPEDLRQISTPQQRKLCPRHKRMADEGTNLKLQQVRSCQIANACTMVT